MNDKEYSPYFHIFYLYLKVHLLSFFSFRMSVICSIVDQSSNNTRTIPDVPVPCVPGYCCSSFFWKHFFDFFKIKLLDLVYRSFVDVAQIRGPKSAKSSILPIAMKGPASFALLFVQNYAILDLGDKIYTGVWWIPKCCFLLAFLLLFLSNRTMLMFYTYTCVQAYR